MEIKEFKTNGIIYEKRVFEMDIKVILDGKSKTLQCRMMEDDNGSEISYWEIVDGKLVDLDVKDEDFEKLDELVETYMRTEDKMNKFEIL